MADPLHDEPISDLKEPVRRIPTDRDEKPQPGIALCLSGGGYRALLFHCGALLRLNEIGLLPQIARISSVSGGSITAALLGLKWKDLHFNQLKVASRLIEEVINPLRKFSETTIDTWSILGGVMLPGSASERAKRYYKQYLFGDATLQDLPDDWSNAHRSTEGPRFVINSTNVQSGVLWRFMKPYMRDYRVGEIRSPKLELAVAVAASAAFPPFLSPLTLEFSPNDFTPSSGLDLQVAPYTTKVFLTDGGVYDNLGLETAWKRYKTILISDAGQNLTDDPTPDTNWLSHSKKNR